MFITSSNKSSTIIHHSFFFVTLLNYWLPCNDDLQGYCSVPSTNFLKMCTDMDEMSTVRRLSIPVFSVEHKWALRVHLIPRVNNVKMPIKI